MSRLLRAFLESDAGALRGGGLAHRWRQFLDRPGEVAPGDLAAAATLLAKRPSALDTLLREYGATDAQRLAPVLLSEVAGVAMVKLATFGPREAAELLHAMSRAPVASRDVLRENLQEGSANSDAIVRLTSSLEPRGVALVANAYAQLRIRDRAVLRGLARAGASAVSGTPPRANTVSYAGKNPARAVPVLDAQAAASLAYAFATLQTYHHGLFAALQQRLFDVASELGAAEVAQCFFAFARSLPPPSKAEPLAYAFDEDRGFGRLFGALVRRLQDCIQNPASISRETALLALRALDMLHLRDESLLSGLFQGLPFHQLTASELCYALHAAAKLEFATNDPVWRQPFLLIGLSAASPEQTCIIVSALALLLYAPLAKQRRTTGTLLLVCPTAFRVWLRLISASCAAALAPSRESGDKAVVAEPHVALSCLVLLPHVSSTPSAAIRAGHPAERWLSEHASLHDARQVQKFAHSMVSSARQSSHAAGLQTSEMQASVELCLRGLALDSPAKHPGFGVARSEVRAPPYWIDIVLDSEARRSDVGGIDWTA